MADQIARVREAGRRPVIVTSAAIACGLEALGIVERPHDMPSLQAAASVGQGALFGRLCAGVRPSRPADVGGAAHAARHGRPHRLPACPGHASAPAGAGRGAGGERERHRVGGADPLRRQRHAGRAGGLPHRRGPHGHPVRHRRAVRREPAPRGRRPPHRPRRAHRPGRHGRGGRGRHHRGVGRHDHEDQGGARAHGGRHTHGHLQRARPGRRGARGGGRGDGDAVRGGAPAPTRSRRRSSGSPSATRRAAP